MEVSSNLPHASVADTTILPTVNADVTYSPVYKNHVFSPRQKSHLKNSELNIDLERHLETFEDERTGSNFQELLATKTVGGVKKTEEEPRSFEMQPLELKSSEMKADDLNGNFMNENVKETFKGNDKPIHDSSDNKPLQYSEVVIDGLYNLEIFKNESKRSENLEDLKSLNECVNIFVNFRGPNVSKLIGENSHGSSTQIDYMNLTSGHQLEEESTEQDTLDVRSSCSTPSFQMNDKSEQCSSAGSKVLLESKSLQDLPSCTTENCPKMTETALGNPTKPPSLRMKKENDLYKTETLESEIKDEKHDFIENLGVFVQSSSPEPRGPTPVITVNDEELKYQTSEEDENFVSDVENGMNLKNEVLSKSVKNGSTGKSQENYFETGMWPTVRDVDESTFTESQEIETTKLVRKEKKHSKSWTSGDIEDYLMNCNFEENMRLGFVTSEDIELYEWKRATGELYSSVCMENVQINEKSINDKNCNCSLLGLYVS